MTSGLALAVTLIDQLARLSPSIDGCADQLPVNDESAVGPLLGELGLAAACGLGARIAYCMLATFGTLWLRQRAHTKALRVLATRDAERGILVLDHNDPACYCLPGRPGTVVVTTGALRVLTQKQLQAVLAHERAHLAGRHHLILAFALAVRRAVPRVRLLVYAEAETRRLIELTADDAAADHFGAATVASALAVIGAGHLPGAALGIQGGDLPPAAARVTRLIGADRRLRGRARLVSLLAATAAVAVPVLLMVLSTMTVVRHCPPSTDDENTQGAVGSSAAGVCPFGEIARSGPSLKNEPDTRIAPGRHRLASTGVDARPEST